MTDNCNLLQEGEVYIYTLYSPSNTKKQFSTKIYVPGMYTLTTVVLRIACAAVISQ